MAVLKSVKAFFKSPIQSVLNYVAHHSDYCKGLKSANETLMKDYEGLDHTHKAFVDDYDDLATTQDITKKNYASLTKDFRTQGEEKKGLEESVERLNTDLKQTQTKLSGLEEKYEVTNAENQELTTQNQKSEARKKELTDLCNHRGASMKQLRGVLKDGFSGTEAILKEHFKYQARIDIDRSYVIIDENDTIVASTKLLRTKFNYDDSIEGMKYWKVLQKPKTGDDWIEDIRSVLDGGKRGNFPLVIIDGNGKERFVNAKKYRPEKIPIYTIKHNPRPMDSVKGGDEEELKKVCYFTRVDVSEIGTARKVSGKIRTMLHMGKKAETVQEMIEQEHIERIQKETDVEKDGIINGGDDKKRKEMLGEIIGGAINFIAEREKKERERKERERKEKP